MSRPTPAVMIQGTGSNVGKSLLVAGLCRYFTRQGLKVAPFKPQNMSNNAAVADGGEIGRAQALQARASGLDPHTDMNPILLKPESERGAQVIVQGQRWGTLSARDWGRHKAEFLPKVLESFERLSARADLVIVEGAGSPAEINLRAGDIANMGFAEAADIPVVLAGDIDRGGVIAQLVGTHAVLPEREQARIKGFLVNKFRGDPTLFAEGMTIIRQKTGWEALGLVPYFDEAWKLPAEDILDLSRSGHSDGALKIAVPRLQRMANFDDLDPLSLEPGVSVDIVDAGRALPGDAAVVILTGSKNTIGDLAALRDNGWDLDLAAHVRRGGRIVGLCGGYQMLGTEIHDPEGLEGPAQSVAGLGMLNVETVLRPAKSVEHVRGYHAESNAEFHGYEIHLGETSGPDTRRPWVVCSTGSSSAMSADGLVCGSYVHGIFASEAFRTAVFGPGFDQTDYLRTVETTLDRLATHLDCSIDSEKLNQIARSRCGP